MADYTKKDYFEPGAANDYASASGDYKSQSFEASSTYTINKVVLKLWSGSSAVTLFYVRLYAADGSGLPTGGILATFGSFTLTSLETDPTDETFDNDSYEVTNGNSYCIVCESDDDPDAWRWYSTGTSEYADGNAGTKGYSYGWIARTRDRWFQLWEEDAPALPGKPTNPTPTDEASGVTLHDTTVTWESGGNTDSYNVSYGTLSGFLELVEGGITDLSLALVEGNFSVYGKISYWRVDAVNTQGTTQGDEWVFTTMSFAPPLPTGYTLDCSEDPPVLTGTPTGVNNMMTIKKLVLAANNKIWYEDI